MSISLTVYHCNSKNGNPNKTVINKDEKISISENDYLFIELTSTNILSHNCYLWLSDFKFNLSFVQQSDTSSYHYNINLSTFFEPEDILKFSHKFFTGSFTNTFYKIFLNYYGECTIELEGLNQENEILEIGKLNVESDKIGEIDSLLDYLLEKNHYYWNTVSLTKVEATDKEKEHENILWTIKKIENSLKNVIDKFLPHLDDPIARLVPEYTVDKYHANSVVTEESLLWILENCNVLEASNIHDDGSFLLLNRPYQLTELLIQNLNKDTDILENQAIHGFLTDIFDFFASSMFNIEKVLESITGFTDFKSQIYSSYYLRLKESIRLLQDQTLLIKSALNKYIPVKREHLNIAESNRFQSKQHYYDVYLEISKWISRGEAIFSIDELFSGTRDISKLYEIFCLFKIIDTLSSDFDLKMEESSEAQISADAILDIVGDRRNVLSSHYIFKSNDKKTSITLYYEMLPQKLTTVAKNTRGYRPDFILEIDNGVESKYIILDAKYKRITTIQNYDYQELTLKYLHGIALKKGGYFPVLGLFVLNPIINGQISYYQKNEYTSSKISNSLPLIGRIEMGISPNQPNYFKEVISKLLN